MRHKAGEMEVIWIESVAMYSDTADQFRGEQVTEQGRSTKEKGSIISDMNEGD